MDLEAATLIPCCEWHRTGAVSKEHIPLLADFLWWTNIKQSNMKNKSNTHYTVAISVQITGTAISREHVYFKNKHSGLSFYLGSWPNTFLNFSSEEHETENSNFLVIGLIWSSWANGKEGKERSPGEKSPNHHHKQINKTLFQPSAPPSRSLPKRYTSNLGDPTIQSVNPTSAISHQVWRANSDHTQNLFKWTANVRHSFPTTFVLHKQALEPWTPQVSTRFLMV